jgi:hypothetical protein
MVEGSGLLGLIIGAYTSIVGAMVFYLSRQAENMLTALVRENNFTEQEIVQKFSSFANKDGSLDLRQLGALCASLGVVYLQLPPVAYLYHLLSFYVVVYLLFLLSI